MTNERRSDWRPATLVRWTALAVVCLVIFAPTAVFAQAGPPPKPEDLKGYTLPYFFTLIAFLSVVIPVCMATGRKWDFVADTEEE